MKKLHVLLVLLPVFFMTGCGKKYYNRLDAMLIKGQYAGAEEFVDAEKKSPKTGAYKDKNELIYLFDKGAVCQLAGNYKASTKALQNADDEIEKLYTRSVSDEAWSFFSNDLNIRYSGEDFEQVMVNILKALNFMYAGDFEGARVEAKKADFKLNVFADAAGKDAYYTEDAMARYISAFAYEALGEMNHAYIDYKRCYKAYKKYNKNYGTAIPEVLKQDLVRTAEAMGFYEDVQEWKKEFKGIKHVRQKDLDKKAEVMLVIYDGMPAYKKDVNAMSQFVKRSYALRGVKARVKGREYKGFVAQDVSSMAVKNLEAKNALIILKTAARKVVKQFAKEIPVLNLFIGSEKADTRSWRTIPARFMLVRIPLDPGTHRVKVELVPLDAEREPVIREIEVKAEKKTKKAYPVFAFSI